MRYVIYLLVLANLGYVAWWYRQPAVDMDQTVHPVPPLPAGVKRLVLLKERDAASGNGKAECLSIGPFDSVDGAQQVAGRLLSQGVETRQRETQIQQPAGYWVYIPAASADEARRLVTALTKYNVTDYFSGSQYFVSLGVFADRATAQKRRDEVAAQGYAPQMDERYGSRTVYWLDVKGGAGSVPEQDWDAILAGYSGVRRQTVACK